MPRGWNEDAEKLIKTNKQEGDGGETSILDWRVCERLKNTSEQSCHVLHKYRQRYLFSYNIMIVGILFTWRFAMPQLMIHCYGISNKIIILILRLLSSSMTTVYIEKIVGHVMYQRFIIGFYKCFIAVY